ncbi:M67 family metallopeptidase [Zavarzinia compransoris]|uniref:M67 family metallopeptidase n=1 Tax=Zavarzinia marina TaxID=2911065 RepID=UPI001F3FE28F|nr:M67 family metallopeptidase [Zavarzinia marina]MCF4165713.1 M67 family metallopeptidase [Zavarzinia marina]
MTGRPAIRLYPDAVAALRAHAARELPRECCGLLTGPLVPVDGPADGPVTIDAAVASANLAPPGVADAFELDAALHLDVQRRERAAGRAVLGLYHSHPKGAAIPSPRDRAGAYDHGLVWLIIGPDGAIRAWWPGPEGFVEACIEVAS